MSISAGKQGAVLFLITATSFNASFVWDDRTSSLSEQRKLSNLLLKPYTALTFIWSYVLGFISAFTTFIRA